jgi:hypothetical protein
MHCEKHRIHPMIITKNREAMKKPKHHRFIYEPITLRPPQPVENQRRFFLGCTGVPVFFGFFRFSGKNALETKTSALFTHHAPRNRSEAKLLRYFTVFYANKKIPAIGARPLHSALPSGFVLPSIYLPGLSIGENRWPWLNIK